MPDRCTSASWTGYVLRPVYRCNRRGKYDLTSTYFEGMAGAQQNYLQLGPANCILQTGSLSFDASTFEIWARF